MNNGIAYNSYKFEFIERSSEYDSWNMNQLTEWTILYDPTLPTPSFTCPATSFLPESPVNSIASTSCGNGFIGQKSFTF